MSTWSVDYVYACFYENKTLEVLKIYLNLMVHLNGKSLLTKNVEFTISIWSIDYIEVTIR